MAYEATGRTTNVQLEKFVDELVEDRVFKTRGMIAEACGMTDSGFSRAVQHEGTLSVESCLRLAAALKEHPTVILRVAGREQLATILDELCRGKEFHLNRSEREHIRLWRLISPSERHLFDSMLLLNARRAHGGAVANAARDVTAMMWDRAKSKRRRPTKTKTTKR